LGSFAPAVRLLGRRIQVLRGGPDHQAAVGVFLSAPARVSQARQDCNPGFSTKQRDGPHAGDPSAAKQASADPRAWFPRGRLGRPPRQAGGPRHRTGSVGTRADRGRLRRFAHPAQRASGGLPRIFTAAPCGRGDPGWLTEDWPTGSKDKTAYRFSRRGPAHQTSSGVMLRISAQQRARRQAGDLVLLDLGRRSALGRPPAWLGDTGGPGAEPAGGVSDNRGFVCGRNEECFRGPRPGHRVVRCWQQAT